ncbi:hypothetical protein SAMN05445504_2398 [Burkholderia sp. CF099]|nr:hypothetical protein SAMN05445504_2398 [Burkholderia sp. CF099]
MNHIPKSLTMRPISDADVVLWRQLFHHAGRFNTPERRAAMYTALVLTCLKCSISMHDLFNREI